ncbi:dehydrogenase/reductase SDR family member 12-like [Asterias rubens]|uniref:dehydrogenase/reductase SDR family member 12-like n=1 Tax=Asterias rubens TaxID=7604 RepID=UPI0014555076|nr:dehydrogenase/reductase SDR family member 12-like [Asterias rubens]
MDKLTDFEPGFLAASKNFDENDLKVDLSGKSFMLTGANTGIGKSVTMELAKRGGTVHMLCQYADEETRKEVVEKTGNENIHLHVLELSKPREVYEFATKFAKDWKELHVLVNNAADVVYTREITDFGFEKNFAINTMGPYLLTKTLLPTINKTPGSRVIMVSTCGVYPEKLNLSDLNNENMEPFDGHDCYARGKRQQLIMTEMWAKEYPNVHFSAMRPGITDTPLLYKFLRVTKRTRDGKSKLRAPEQGADTVVWLCVAEKVAQQPSAQLYLDRSVISMHKPELDTDSPLEEKQQLMRTLEKLADDVRKDA